MGINMDKAICLLDLTRFVTVCLWFYTHQWFYLNTQLQTV